MRKLKGNGMTYKRSRLVPWRVVEGKAVLVSVKRSEVIVLNDIGTQIWVFLEGKKNLNEIVENVHFSFEADRETIKNDVVSFLENMREKEVLDVE